MSLPTFILTAVLALGGQYFALESELRQFASTQDARIGIAVIVNDSDTISVNGDDAFPMLSVYKFPQALAVAEHCRTHGIALSDSIDIAAEEMRENTYSPMRDKYGSRELRLPIGELLAYSVQQSDNNACDILFRLIGGPQQADSLMKSLGFSEINIRSTEDEMHRDLSLCQINSSSPKAMAALLNAFDARLRHRSPEFEAVAELMETCSTGADRLAAALPADATIGHKTGTGDTDARGRIIALNDAAYIRLPDSIRYSIAVFIAESALSPSETAATIARISALTLQTLQPKNPPTLTRPR